MQYAKENNIELNERQEAGIKTMEKLSSALGLDMYIFESFEVNGQMKYKTEDGKILSAPNGIYYDNGKIYIDLNAGVSIKGLMHYTIAHELTHFIRQWSPEKFKILADYLMDEYGKREVSVSKLIKNEQRKADKKGMKLDFDTAYEEVIAHSMEDILTSGHVEEFVTGIKQKDVNLWNKIKQWFQNLWTDLKAAVEAYKGFKPESVEGQIVSNMQDVIKDLEALFAQGLLDASDNYQAAKNGTEVKENTTTDSGATAKMQLRNANGKDVVWIEDAGITNAQLNDYKFVANYIADHIGEVYKIIESGQSVYIGEDLPGEFTQSKYTNSLLKNRRKLLKAKKKTISNLGELIESATNRRWEKTKHNQSKDAKFGMYRYDVRFGFAAKNANGDVAGANVYNAEILIRNASDGKKYLYDIVGIKKDTANSAWLTQRVTRAADYSTAQKSNVFTENIPQQSAEVNEKFHLRESVEETKNLVALHNLTEDKLAKSLELGGFPMPSIAITKSDIPHTNFGDITLVFGKETIDPKASKKNTVYSADAWTPTFPQVEYEADRDVSAKISKKHSEIAKQYGYEFARPLYSSANYVEDELNRYGGEQGIVEHFANDTDMMQVFLADTGKTPVENVVSETVTRIADDKIAEYDFLISNLGKDVIGELTAKAGQSPLEARKAWLANYGEDLKEAFRQYLIADGMAETTANEAVKDMKPGSLIHEAIAARNYMRNGAETRKTSIDYSATRNAIKEAVNAEEYKAWLQDLYSGVEKDKGVYNQKDRYTTSGNLKSFKQTHLPYTLDGIVKAMASQNGGNIKNVSGFNGVKTLRAGTAERFSSIADMHKREGRLQHLTQEQADQISDELQNRTYELIDRVDKANSQKGDSNSFIRFDTIGEILMGIAESGSYNVSDIQSVFSKYSRAIGDDLAIEIKQLLFDISQMPVNIFEAKPERAVAFSEIKAAVLPNGTSQEVVNGLKQNGVPVMFYEQGNNEQRLERVNSVANAKFHMRGDPDVERVNRVLEKENAKLKEDVADLRAMLKLQRQVTNGTKFTKTSVEAAAKMLKKNMDAKGSTKELSGLLNTFYEYIASAKELSWEDVVEQAKPAAQWLLDNEKRTVDDSYARDILRELHGSKMYLDEQQRQEAAHQFGSYDEFRKKMMGTVWFVKEENGISMDSKWVELSESYPNLFPADTVSTDMPRVFAEAVDTLRNMTYEPEFSEQYNMPIQDVIYQVYDSYWRVNNLRTIADVKQGQINKLKAKCGGR